MSYVLTVKLGYLVDHIMLTDDRTRVLVTTSFEEAKKMLSTGEVRETDDIEEYPLTVDGKNFFPGFLETTCKVQRKGRKRK